MTSYQIIKLVIAIGLAAGGIAFCVNENLWIGQKFREGFAMAGQMMLSIAGIMTIAPVLANILKPVVVPLFQMIGADPACFSSILGCDMGGYPLAVSLAESQEVAKMMGLAPAAMLGGTLTFAIPVARAVLTDEDFQFFSKGMLLGLLSIPFGSMAGGLIQGLSLEVVLINHVPILVLSAFLMLGFRYFADKLVKAVDVFGKAITKIGLAGLIAGGITHLTGITIIPGMPPVMDGMATVCGMVFILAGTMPLLELFNRAVKGPLNEAGKRAGMDAVSVSGFLFTLASCVPTCAMMKNMTKRGIVLNSTWLVTCVGLLGSQIGFVLQEAPEMLASFAAAKLISGALAMGLALAMTRNMKTTEAVETVEDRCGNRHYYQNKKKEIAL